MKPHLLAVLLVTFFVGCGQKPLSEAECQTLADKEIEFALSKAPAEEVEALRAFLEERSNTSNQQCMAGQTYHRSDYRCMVKANDPTSIGKCIASVNKRLGL